MKHVEHRVTYFELQPMKAILFNIFHSRSGAGAPIKGASFRNKIAAEARQLNHHFLGQAIPHDVRASE